MRVWTGEAADLCYVLSSDLCSDLYSDLYCDLCCDLCYDLCCDLCRDLWDSRLIHWSSDHFLYWSDDSGETSLTEPPPRVRSGSSALWENQPGDRPESPAPGPPRCQLQHTDVSHIRSDTAIYILAINYTALH